MTRVSITLALIGGVVGALLGMGLLAVLSLYIDGPGGFPYYWDAFIMAGFVGALLGAVALPVASVFVLPGVRVGRVVLETAIGTSAGGATPMTRVRLSDIVDGMDVMSDQMTSYLHRPTGRVLWVSEEALRAAEEDDDDSVEPEELADARAVLGGGEDYLAFPDRFEIDEYRMMEQFAAEIEDSRQSDEALASLRGAKAFRRFKDTVHQLALSDAWYAFRERAYIDVART